MKLIFGICPIFQEIISTFMSIFQCSNTNSNQFLSQVSVVFIIFYCFSIRQIYYHYLQSCPLPNLMSTVHPNHLQSVTVNQNMRLFKKYSNYREMEKEVESDQWQLPENQLSFANIQENRGNQIANNQLIYSDIYRDDNDEDSLFGNQCQFLGNHRPVLLEEESKIRLKSSFEDKNNVQMMKNAKRHQPNSAWEMNADHILRILRENDQNSQQKNKKRVTSLSQKNSISVNEGFNPKTLILKQKPCSVEENQFTSEKYMSKKIKIQNSKKQNSKDARLMINKQKNKICKTQYEGGTLDPIKFFQQLQLQKQSLQCTFKPTPSILLNQQVIKNKAAQNVNNKNKQINLKTNNTSILKNINVSQRIRTLGDEHENRAFKQPVLSKIFSDYIPSNFDVIARNKLWQQQKEQKLSKLRKEEEQKKCKIQNYSHSPMIIQYKVQCEPKISKFRKEGTVQHIQRLSMAKRKTSVMSFKQEQTVVGKQQAKCLQKQNISHIINKQKCTINYQGKRRTYEQAVKQLHNKINKMKI